MPSLAFDRSIKVVLENLGYNVLFGMIVITWIKHVVYFAPSESREG